MKKILLLITLLSIGILANAQSWTNFNSFGLQRKIVSGDTTWRFVGSGTNGFRLFNPDGGGATDSATFRTVANSYSLSGMQTKLNSYTLQTRSISTGFGLSGGGNLTANRTIGADTSTIRTVANSASLSDLQSNYARRNGGNVVSGSTWDISATKWNGQVFTGTEFTGSPYYAMGFDISTVSWRPMLLSDFRNSLSVPPDTRSINAGYGLLGGGNLTTDRTIYADSTVVRSWSNSLSLSQLQTRFDAKQATLVSGTNIKTIGGVSILGSGDISVGGTGTVTSVSAGYGMSFTTITGTGAVASDSTVLRTVANSFTKAQSQPRITLTTTGTGAATFNAGTGALNIPIPSAVGTVTNVTSANGDISVATGTSTPVLTLNSSTISASNKIVKYNGNGDLNIGTASGTRFASLTSGQDIGYFAGTSGQGAHYWYTNNGATGVMNLSTTGSLDVRGTFTAHGTTAGSAGTDSVVVISNGLLKKIPATYYSVGTGASNLALGTPTSTTYPITNSNGTGFTLPSATTSVAGLMSAADKSKSDNQLVITSFTTSGSGAASLSAGNLNIPTPSGAGTSGTYTPSVSNSTNCSDFVLSTAHYIRVGNEVTVQGRLRLDYNAANTPTFNLSLPIASSLSSAQELSGLGAINDGPNITVTIIGDGTNDAAYLGFTSIGAGTDFYLNYSFTYTVI